MQFDMVLANPPYSIKQWNRDAWAADSWGRNIYGTPPQGRADYAFWQHIIKSMKAKSGRCAILFPHGVLFRNEELAMRKKLLAHDVVECVIGLGPNLFYNSPMEACVVICRMNKPKERKNKVLFINAVHEVTRERAQSFLTYEHIQCIVAAYRGDNRVETVREQEGSKGYACGFEELIGFVLNLLPTNEVIGQALRKEVPMFPELAIRELVANALIHQDFQQTGTGPMIEIFASRMEITNPGVPLVKTERFLDSPPKSRNEALASFMRRIGVCEERGSGVDKVVYQTEYYQLPAPVFEKTDEHTRSVLFAHREFKDMDKQDRIRATYLHACLRYVQRNYMTNSTLRERFGIEEQNSAMASRIIKDALDAGEIRPFDDSSSRKYMKYVPGWA